MASCKFNEYRNALGVYRVVTDSILSSVNFNGKSFDIEKDIPNLIAYFSTFDEEAVSANEFIQRATEFVADSYNSILETLKDSGILDNGKLTSGEEKLLRENFHNQLAKGNPSISADHFIKKNSTEPIELGKEGSAETELPTRITVGGVQPIYSPEYSSASMTGSLSIPQNLNVATDKVTTEKDVLDNYFISSGIAGQAMLRELTKQVFNLRILSPFKIKGRNADSDLNVAIRKYKSELFQTMLRPLTTEEVPKLYDDFGNLHIKDFNDVLKQVKSYFASLNNGVGVKGADLTAWNMAGSQNTMLRDAYNAYVMLKHFDTLIESRSAGSIRVKENYRNQETSSDKYINTSVNKMRTGYTDETIIHADDETTQLYKMFVSTIPTVKLNGRVSLNSFLSTNALNHTFGKIKSEIDNTDPVGSIEKVIVDILSNLENRGGRSLSNEELSTILSLYARVFRTHANDSTIIKSNPSFTNILNGINSNQDLSVDNSIKTLFGNVHSDGQDINFLDLIGSNIAKVDNMSYHEITYNYNTNSFESKNLTSGLSNRQKSQLRSNIGGSLLFAKKSRLDSYGMTIDGNKSVDINLPSGDSIRYSISSGELSYVTRDGDISVINGDISNYINIPNGLTDSADLFQNITGDMSSFNDYKYLAHLFEGVLNQPLSSDNYKLLDVMRAEIDGYNDDSRKGAHVETMLTLLGNYGYLASLNIKLGENANSLSNGTKMRNLATFSGLKGEDLWDINQSRYKVDFNKAGMGALSDLASVLSSYYGTSIQAVIKNPEGNLMPTTSLMSSMNRYKDVIEDYQSRKNYNSPLAGNLLVQAFNDKENPLILGTPIRQAIKSKSGDVISPTRFNVKELLQSSILYEFLQDKINNNGNFKIQPSNYADKGKHGLLQINGKTKITTVNGEIKAYKDLTVDELKGLYFKTIYDQYEGIANAQINNYDKLFESPEQILSSFISGDTAFLRDLNVDFNTVTYEEIPDEVKGTDFDNEWAKFVDLRTSLNEYNSDNGDTLSKLKKADKVFSLLSSDTIRRTFNNLKIPYTTNLSFEKNPTTGKMGVNGSLIQELIDFSKGKEAKIKKVEGEFLKSLQAERFTLDFYNDDMTPNGVLKNINNYYTFVKGEFPVDPKTGRMALVNTKGDLNPILKDYLWNNLLIGRNFQFLTVGTPLGHPAKVTPDMDADGKKIPPTHDQIMAARLVAQNKRMVIHPATMHPYTMNLINGVGFKSNKVFISDPAAPVYNLTGLTDMIDAPDGSSLMNPAQANLYNSSLTDQKVGRTHKSIAGSMDVDTGAAGLTKHAGFSITNENLRNSPLLNTLNMQMLNRKFGVIGDSTINIDLTKDYNGKHIDLNKILGEVSFTANEFDTFSSFGEIDTSDVGALSTSDLLSFNDLIKNSDGTYTAIYTVNNSDDFVTWTGEVDTYYKLWQLLGGRYSVEYSDNNLGNSSNSILDGYTNSNTSWDALTEYINRVGFWYNSNESDGEHLTLHNALNAESDSLNSLKAEYNKYIHNPNSVADNYSPDNSRPTQKNIIQPLKLNFLGELTFASGQKVGATNVMSMQELLEGNITTSVVSNLHNGIQLNADHEADQSEVTEQTQVLGTLPFTGNTPEYTKKVFNSINRYIEQNLGELMRAFNDRNYKDNKDSQEKVNKLLKRIIVKTFDDKEADTLANSLVQVIKKEINERISSNMNMPLSVPDLYGSVNTALANHFTKEGIRRKLPGMAAVAKPYSQMTKFKHLPDGTAVSYSQFKKWREDNPDVAQYTPLKLNHLKLGDTVLSPSGETYELSNPKDYLLLKKRLFTEGVSGWTVDNFADKELRSTHHMFDIENVGSFSYFDIDLFALPHLLNDVKDKHGTVLKLQKAIGNGHILSQLQISQNGTFEERLATAQQQLNESVELYNAVLASSGANPSIIPPMTADKMYAGLNIQQQNYLRNAINRELSSIHDRGRIRTPLFSGLTEVDYSVNIRTVMGEIAMSFPHATTFGIPKGMDVSDVTEGFFFNKLNRVTMPENTPHDLYMPSTDGNHLYVLIEGSANHKGMMGSLEPVIQETVESNGKRYTTDRYGEPKELIGYNTLYRGTHNGVESNYVVVSPSNFKDLQNLREMLGSGSKYNSIIPNFTDNSDLVPTFNKLVQNGLLDVGDKVADTLMKAATLQGKLDGDEGSVEMANRLRGYRFTRGKMEQFRESINEQLAGKISNNKRAELLSEKAVVESYLSLLDERNMKGEDDFDVTSDSGFDLTRQIYAIQNNRWANYRYQRGGSDVEVSNGITQLMNELNANMLERIVAYNQKKAKATYASFLKSLEVTTARIPGQDRQSYAGMKVVHFFNDEENTIYVPPKFQWTTGGDFDIDKVFTSYFSVGRDGLIAGWSTFFDKRDINYLNESLRLPVPDGKAPNVTFEMSPNAATSSDLQAATLFLNGERDLDTFKKVVNLLRRVDAADGNLIISQTLSKEDVSPLVSLVTDFKVNSGNVPDARKATLNIIFSGIKDSITDIRNIAEAYLPVSFGEYQEKAKKSKKGKEMSKMSYENPVDIFRVQVANMIGREVIGISASSGLKGFSAMATVMNDVKRGGNGVRMEKFLIPYVTPEGELVNVNHSGLKGIDFLGNIDEYRAYLQKAYPKLTPDDIETILRNMWKQGSVTLDLSAVLSAATD